MLAATRPPCLQRWYLDRSLHPCAKKGIRSQSHRVDNSAHLLVLLLVRIYDRGCCPALISRKSITTGRLTGSLLGTPAPLVFNDRVNLRLRLLLCLDRHRTVSSLCCGTANEEHTSGFEGGGVGSVNSRGFAFDFDRRSEKLMSRLRPRTGTSASSPSSGLSDTESSRPRTAGGLPRWRAVLPPSEKDRSEAAINKRVSSPVPGRAPVKCSLATDDVAMEFARPCICGYFLMPRFSLRKYFSTI